MLKDSFSNISLTFIVKNIPIGPAYVHLNSSDNSLLIVFYKLVQKAYLGL